MPGLLFSSQATGCRLLIDGGYYPNAALNQYDNVHYNSFEQLQLLINVYRINANLLFLMLICFSAVTITLFLRQITRDFQMK